MYCTTGFVIGICKSIIIDFMTISQKIIYTLLSSFMHRSLKVVVSDSNLPPFLLLLNILEHMCFTTFYNEYNPSPNSVKLMVDKFLTFHENIEVLSSGDFYDLSPVNNEPTEHITLVFVEIPVRNQPNLVEASKED